MTDVRTIAKAIGRKALADRLDVTVNAVHEAVRAERFPAAWFVAVREMAQEHGLEAPEALFNWKGAA